MFKKIRAALTTKKLPSRLRNLFASPSPTDSHHASTDPHHHDRNLNHQYSDPTVFPNTSLPNTSLPNTSVLPLRYNRSPIQWLGLITITSAGVAVLVLGIRELRWLESWEFNTYDQMLRLRSSEPLDKRLLVVGIDGNDKQNYSYPLSDDLINKLLGKIQTYRPRIIGLNVSRPQQKNLAFGEYKKNIITVCTHSTKVKEEIPPAPNFPKVNVGFNDLLPDKDRIVRRILLTSGSDQSKDSNSKCQAEYSFAALLAIDYLKKENINYEVKPFQLGEVVLPALTANSGSYKNLDFQGYQILLNYRHFDRRLDKFVRTVSLSDILENRVKSSWLKDRLVIIGITDRDLDHSIYTPYTNSDDPQYSTSSVYIHAQIVSQLISSVLDDRPFIRYFPERFEVIWICLWAAIGALFGWRLRHPMILLVSGGMVFAVLVGICYLVFLQGIWIPVVPPALALIISGFGVMTYTTYQMQQQTKLMILQVAKQKEAIEQLDLLLKENSGTQDIPKKQDIKQQDISKQQESAKQKNKLLEQPTSPSPNVTFSGSFSSGSALLAHRYEIRRILGQGGFGCTYLAKDTQRPGNPTCVVKQLMPARRDTRFLQVARRLFDAEAEILEIVGKHPQIPELLAYFEENQEFYLVEEYIRGRSLEAELSLINRVGDESSVIKMLIEILEVLVYIHEYRVIHRDIKPSNIIRNNSDGRLVLIDFGAVKKMQPPNAEQTELPTVAIGTRGYTPPEQFAGHPRLASDIYALGMIGIQALTGRFPHDFTVGQDTGDILWREGTQVSDRLAMILDKMTHYHFSDRYQSAGEVLKDLKMVSAQ